MKSFLTLMLIFIGTGLFAQNASIKGQLQDQNGEAVGFANVALYSSIDSNLVKVESSGETGLFLLQGIAPGSYFLQATFVGFQDFKQDVILTKDQQLDLGVLSFPAVAADLEEVTVTARRAMVEIKPDRTVFNVQGTINSVGENAISLLRKAPSVTVDNNDNINVLGRSGVLLYVDGKRLPLVGDDLSAFLQSLPAEQIDRIDIITNPGARYEAEGNAGIIDIRLKKDKNLGGNGSVTGSFSQGRYARENLNVSGNYRNKKMNIFGSAGVGQAKSFNDMEFESIQNGLFLDESDYGVNTRQNYDYRVGLDFFVAKQHTIGFLIGGRVNGENNESTNRLTISPVDQFFQKPSIEEIDSILVANNRAFRDRSQNSFNVNYRFDNAEGRSLNIDLDYGTFNNDTRRYQPNQYFDGAETRLLSESIDSFDTPTDINIYTFKLDFEEEVLGGKLGIGTKISRVESDNNFIVFDQQEGIYTLDNSRSNIFDYDESVYAGYVNFARSINKKWNFSAGLRAEQTDAVGDLQAFDPSKQQEPVLLNYLSFFPSAGLTWQVGPTHVLALNYGRRINRPDYNVLNPFNNQLSELSYERGNPNLRPEIVNNVELGYTLAYRYNFKLAYSQTTDQITRLIAPDSEDERANFISWDNLADQSVISFNVSAPVQITKKWNAYFNASASYIDNQADYGDGAVVDVQVFNYVIFQQHTFDLPAGLKGELSGYYSGPGVWGGVFRYEASSSVSVGLQRKFLKDQLNIRLSGSDLFYRAFWQGVSEFNGLISSGTGRNDTRRFSISASYLFGNQNIKSRKRKTGLEEEAGRVKS